MINMTTQEFGCTEEKLQRQLIEGENGEEKTHEKLAYTEE